MALVTVLWALSILSLIAAGVLSSSSLSYRMERNSWTQTQAEFLTEAAVNRAVLGLIDQRANRRWRVDGVPREFEFGGARFTVWIQDELGKVDLNVADEQLIKGLFSAAGLTNSDAEILTDRVLDWRRPGETKRLKGATEEDYRAAGEANRPRGGPFQSIDELRLVLGMTEDLFLRLEPAITVYSQRRAIEPLTAPRLALLALPGMDQRKVEEILVERHGEAIALSGQGSGEPSTGTISPIVPLHGCAFSIRVAVEWAGRVFVRDAVVRLTDDPQQPYWLLEWHSSVPRENER